MRKTRIRRISERQKAEKAEAIRLKAELMAEWNGICPDCGQQVRNTWPKPQLIHRIAKGQGGKTDRKNCYIGCYRCHMTIRHHERIAEDK